MKPARENTLIIRNAAGYIQEAITDEQRKAILDYLGPLHQPLPQAGSQPPEKPACSTSQNNK